MAKTSNQHQIDLVRVLAMEIGIRPAARKLNVNEDTACKWAERYHWNISGKAQNGRPHSVSTLSASPVDVLVSEMEQHERKTKLGLASYASIQAQHLAKNGKLTDSGHFKNVAGGASIVHRWDSKSENTQNVIVNVALLGVQPHDVSVETLDVDSGVSG